MSGLFSIFNVSKRGMMANQTALNVVSHNIANADTDGYSVQRANLKTTTPFGVPSLNTAKGPGQLGTGVEVDSITRARDSFLDTQIRKENATSNQYTARQEFLSEIETIYNEPSDTGLSTTMSQFWDSWQQLATNPESSTARTLVLQNGQTLATALNHTYTQLEDLQSNSASVIKKQIFSIGTDLTQIQDLNTQIKAATISGQQPNDLMDTRDNLLDDLSQYFDFDIKKTDFNGIEINAKVDNNGTTENILKDGKINYGVAYVNNVTFSAKVKDSDKDGKLDADAAFQTFTLNDLPKTIPADAVFNGGSVDLQIDGDINKEASSYATIGTIDDLKNYFDVEDVKDSTGKITGYNIRSIKPHTVMYNTSSYDATNKTVSDSYPVNFQSGSLNGYESISQEINTYKDQLNNLAKALAVGVNTIHSGTVTAAGTDTNKLNFFVSANENSTNAKTYDTISEIESDGEAAKHIAVNNVLKDVSKINAGKVTDRTSTDYKSGNGDRALLMGQFRNTRIDVLSITDRASFKTDSNLDLDKLTITSTATGSTLDGYFQNTISYLGVSGQEANTMVTNQKALLDQLDVRKESTSGVSLDEEMTNMIQFQRSYEANSKMISVLDELLDVVVNGLVK